MDEKFEKIYEDRKEKFRILECKEFFELSPKDLQKVISKQSLTLPEFSILAQIGVQKYSATDINVGAIPDHLFSSPVDTIAFILQKDIPGFYFQQRFKTFDELEKEYPFPSLNSSILLTNFNFTWSMEKFANDELSRLIEAKLATKIPKTSDDLLICYEGNTWSLNREASNLFLLIGG